MQENRPLLGNRTPSTGYNAKLCLAIFIAALGGLVISIGFSEMLTLNNMDEIELAERCQDSDPGLPVDECREHSLLHIVYLMLVGGGIAVLPLLIWSVYKTIALTKQCHDQQVRIENIAVAITDRDVLHPI